MSSFRQAHLPREILAAHIENSQQSQNQICQIRLFNHLSCLHLLDTQSHHNGTKEEECARLHQLAPGACDEVWKRCDQTITCEMDFTLTYLRKSLLATSPPSRPSGQAGPSSSSLLEILLLCESLSSSTTLCCPRPMYTISLATT